MIVRAATSEDAAGIAAIWTHNIRHTANTFTDVEKTTGDLEALISARGREGKAFLVAEGDAGVIGFATYFQFRGGPGYARTCEHTVMIDRSAFGRGVGRALMTALEAQARSTGIHSLMAGVSAENTAGVGFHEALGYVQVARLPEVGYKFGRWMDLILLQKLL